MTLARYRQAPLRSPRDAPEPPCPLLSTRCDLRALQQRLAAGCVDRRPGPWLPCANHVERGSCDNRRTILRDRLLDRVLVGLKERLLAPELVETFVRSFVEEVNAANRERGARRKELETELGRLDRQVRNLLELLIYLAT